MLRNLNALDLLADAAAVAGAVLSDDAHFGCALRHRRLRWMRGEKELAVGIYQ